MSDQVTLLAVAHGGRLEFEALLLAASWARAGRQFPLVLAAPEGAEPLSETGAGLLVEFGAQIRPFTPARFGPEYPIGYKMDALAACGQGRTILLDTDTLLLGQIGEIDFSRPTGSLRRSDTWPKPGQWSRADIWGALYDKFGLTPSLDPSLDPTDWQAFPYYNAGIVITPDGAGFGESWAAMADAIRSDPPPELEGQSLTPWLDQIALPLALVKSGGGANFAPGGGLDSTASCHYRTLPLLYAREGDAVVACLEEIAAPNRIKQHLKTYPPMHEMIYRGAGSLVREEYFGRFEDEQSLRRALKAAGLWMR